MSDKLKKNTVLVCIFIIVVALVWMWHISAVPDAGPIYPSVSAQIEQNGEFRRLDVAEGGSYKKTQSSNTIREADFRILAPHDSISAQQENTVLVDETGSVVRFSIETDNTLSGVQVLRWPVSLYGCGKALDVAERISYTKRGNKSEFLCEKGYLYSIYITWDEFFVEYVFRTE